MTPEQKASQNVLLRASDWHCRLLRNNSGAAYNPDGSQVRFGLGNESAKMNRESKSSDFIGLTPVVITQDMVGKTVAVFTAIEAKPEGFVEKQSYPKSQREYGQKNFIDWVLSFGGIAGFASTWQDVDRIIKRFYQK